MKYWRISDLCRFANDWALSEEDHLTVRACDKANCLLPYFLLISSWTSRMCLVKRNNLCTDALRPGCHNNFSLYWFGDGFNHAFVVAIRFCVWKLGDAMFDGGWMEDDVVDSSDPHPPFLRCPGIESWGPRRQLEGHGMGHESTLHLVSLKALSLFHSLVLTYPILHPCWLLYIQDRIRDMTKALRWPTIQIKRSSVVKSAGYLFRTWGR